jgi:aconitate hydratase
LRRNAERIPVPRWGSKTLEHVRIHPPGTGIMHTINLEQLATVVSDRAARRRSWAMARLMIGTDSHTPMVNGIGVLAWGVGASRRRRHVRDAVRCAFPT